MGLSPKEQMERKNDPHVRFIMENITTHSNDKDYVFVSYKSDDWKLALHDLVYKLMTEYGLRIYFDGSFDDHNETWIEQFPENMEDPGCKAVLMFLDDKYARSYATLLEFMYSQTDLASIGGKQERRGLPVVPVNLYGPLKNPDNSEGKQDTGLGKEQFGDGSRNAMAGREKELFDETFEELTDEKRKGFRELKSWYKGKRLNRRMCHEITLKLLERAGVSENYYYPEETDRDSFLRSIVNIIRDVAGESVFADLTEYGFCKEKSFMKESSKKEEEKVSVQKKKELSAANLTLEQSQLYEKLRTFRNEAAKAEKIRPFRVFQNDTLVELCIRRPKNQAELLKIRGIAEVKCAKYGNQLLKILNESRC